jgi:hypothetical protein
MEQSPSQSTTLLVSPPVHQVLVNPHLNSVYSTSRHQPVSPTWRTTSLSNLLLQSLHLPLSSPRPHLHPINVTPQLSCKTASKQAKLHRQPRNMRWESERMLQVLKSSVVVIPFPGLMFPVRQLSWIRQYIIVLMVEVTVSA